MSLVLTVVSVLGVALSAWWVIEEVRRHRIGVDLIALAALIGTLIVRERVAGAVITVMLVTGRALEAWAAGRAERSLHALLSRAPRVAHRHEGDRLTHPALAEVLVGDLLLVQPGEVVPVDGIVEGNAAVIDDSALTGESVLVDVPAGEPVRGGAVNAGAPFDLRATTVAADSVYAGIVRLVEQASATSSPFVRIADRFAVAFLGVAFGLAGGAWWLTGELDRAVAVLVVATPCPLILAAPVAIVSGLSRAARRGVVIKGGGALEALADGDVLLFDKTGTITMGRPTVAEVLTAPGFDADELRRLAASLDQVSPHVLAASIVRAAHERRLPLSMPTDTTETPGAGVSGVVDGALVSVGNGGFTNIPEGEPWVTATRRRSEFAGSSTVFVAVDGVAKGSLILSDPIRHDASRTIRNLRRSGIRRVVIVTGDRREIATSVGALVGVDGVEAELSPADKVGIVERESVTGRTIMVGDGINDAPALAVAGVGVAIGARGSTASSETADIVLTIDRLDRLGEARLIARRSRTIATQSVVTGMALSMAAMLVAAAGRLPATWGAVLQEFIDVAVILNALRALRPGPGERRLTEDEAVVARQFTAAHVDLRPQVMLLRDAADKLGQERSAGSMGLVRAAHRTLVEDIEPHEVAEDRELYPVVAGVLGGIDPTGTMSRTHAEIGRMTAQIGAIVARVGHGAPSDDDARDLQRLLYGLFAVLELHFSQEDESYLSLVDDTPS